MHDVVKQIHFHKRLNPVLWENGALRPEVSKHLRQIAASFWKFVDIENVKILDITISGSNAAFTYSDGSDIDLHIIVRVPTSKEKLYKNFFDTKKNLWNDQHTLSIHGYPVELYVQLAGETHTSAGIYSIKNEDWVKRPEQIKASVDHHDVAQKYGYYSRRIRQTIENDDLPLAKRFLKRLGKYRKQGLASHGEFGTANLVYKILRKNNYIDKLRKFVTTQEDKLLSLPENARE